MLRLTGASSPNNLVYYEERVLSSEFASVKNSKSFYLMYIFSLVNSLYSIF